MKLRSRGLLGIEGKFKRVDREGTVFSRGSLGSGGIFKGFPGE